MIAGAHVLLLNGGCVTERHHGLVQSVRLTVPYFTASDSACWNVLESCRGAQAIRHYCISCLGGAVLLARDDAVCCIEQH